MLSSNAISKQRRSTDEVPRGWQIALLLTSPVGRSVGRADVGDIRLSVAGIMHTGND